ncbi:MAG: hypothetical protein FD166_2987 [Bacteroidetes bacterium]|nr:MAG: hypothetical protein FD166_2987 [Bacteroidota bacterium]
MKTITIISLLASSLSLFIICFSIYIERSTLGNLLKNKRVILFTVLSVVVTIIEKVSGGIISSIFSIKTYYIILCLFLIGLLYWIYQFFFAKKRDLFNKAISKEFNLEEIFIYLLVLVVFFPFITDIVRMRSKEPIEFIVKINSDYANFSTPNSIVNYNGKVIIKNNTDRNCRILVETISTPFQRIEFLDSLMDMNNRQYINHTYKGAIGSNSSATINLVDEQVLMPNFIEGALIDSLNWIFSNESLDYYSSRFNYIYQNLLPQDSLTDNGLNFKFKFPEMGVNYSIDYDWVSKVYITDNYSNEVSVFRFKGSMRHDLGRMIRGEELILTPGVLQNYFMLEPNYLKNGQLMNFTKGAVTVVFNEEVDLAKTIYEESGDNYIYSGELNDNIIINKEGFQIRHYIYGLFIRDMQFYTNLAKSYGVEVDLPFKKRSK